MARRQKPSGREARAAKKAVSDGPLWFDRARSLCELHGWPSSHTGDGLGLVGRYTAAVNKPVGCLDETDFELLFGQKTDPHFLAPLALERVQSRLRSGGVDEGLLRCLLYLDDEFWHRRPYLLAQFVEALEAGRKRLEEGERGDGLAIEAANFVRRHAKR